MEVTKNRCMRESAVRGAKVERLMNNFTITVSVIWKYFHRSDILQQGRKCQQARWLLICLRAFEAIVLCSMTALVLRQEATV